MNATLLEKTKSSINEEMIMNEKIKIGTQRKVIQIQKTIQFEYKKNYSKFKGMLITSLIIFGLFLIINLISEGQDILSPEDPADYFKGYLDMITFLILIIAVTFGGGIIVEDFEKQTGNLLFPKIPKDRLLIGRIIARYTYVVLSVGFYYLLIATTTLIKYGGIPKVIWSSLGWALLYAFLMFSFLILFSALMNRVASAMIMGIIMILMVFSLLQLLLMFTGVTWEPFFVITYYGNIITACFNMPIGDARFGTPQFQMGPGHNEIGSDLRAWITPSATGAIIGSIIYSIICLTLAYLRYKKKQSSQM